MYDGIFKGEAVFFFRIACAAQIIVFESVRKYSKQ
jgi:hypothetical protein